MINITVNCLIRLNFIPPVQLLKMPTGLFTKLRIEIGHSYCEADKGILGIMKITTEHGESLDRQAATKWKCSRKSKKTKTLFNSLFLIVKLFNSLFNPAYM